LRSSERISTYLDAHISAMPCRELREVLGSATENLAISSRAFFWGALFVVVVVAIAPNLAWLAVDSPPRKLVVEILLPALATVGLLLSVAGRLWIGVLLLLPWVVLAPFEAYYILDFGRPSDTHLLGVIADSDVAEASTFLSGIAGGLAALSLAGSALAVFALQRARRLRITWAGRTRWWALCASALALALPELVDLDGPPRSLPIENHRASLLDPNDNLANDFRAQIFGYLLPVYPVGVPGRFLAYLEQRRALNAAKERLEDFRFHARQESVAGREVHVLVIGETGRPDRWQLNAYHRETNPRLMTIEGVVSFKDAFSPWTSTRMSVPLLLTRKSPVDHKVFFPERSLISAFREAGFRTYWLSTQSPLGPHDSSIALHAAEAHEVRFLNPLGYQAGGVLDGALLKPLAEILARDEPKVLVVLHTLGGHFNYADRYPDDLDVFRPSLKGVRNPSLHQLALKEELNNSYDNSLLYLDFFLAEVIGYLSAVDALTTLFYIADHGENLFDGECDKSGHGRDNEYDFRVAALWWPSARYAEAFPEKVAAARSRTASPIATSNVFHSLLDAASIRYPDEDPALSLFSPAWRPAARITQNGIDFDLASRDPICKKLLPTRPRSAS
jgi:glucan phosphoethanolaminetransferase (alkaline phosphatase superfamily)